MKVTEPTLLYGVPDDEYHAGAVRTPGRMQVSQSLLKLLRPPSTPKHFRHRLTHPEPSSNAFDVGRAAHTMALGVGEPMAACPDEFLSSNGAMTTKLAIAWCAEQREMGVVPLNPRDFAMVQGMAEALVAHERIAEILTAPGNAAEVSAFAPICGVDDVWFRARFDLLGGQMWDYKTTKCAAPAAFEKSIWTYGYHVQDFVYRSVHSAITGVDVDPIIFIAQEKEPPYLVSTMRASEPLRRLAERETRDALALLARCLETDTWPGYPDEVVDAQPPRWVAIDASPIEDTTDPEAADVLAVLEGIINAD